MPPLTRSKVKAQVTDILGDAGYTEKFAFLAYCVDWKKFLAQPDALSLPAESQPDFPVMAPEGQNMAVITVDELDYLLVVTSDEAGEMEVTVNVIQR